MKILKIDSYLVGKLFLLASISILAISSCKKESGSLNIENLQKDEQLYNALLKNGIKSSNIVEFDKYYIVEGDLLFAKNNTDLDRLNSYFGKINNTAGPSDLKNVRLNGKIASLRSENKISQWVTPNVVSNEKIETISIKRSDDLSGSLWAAQLETAIEHWASISESKLNFYHINNLQEIGNPNLYVDILVRNDGGILPNNVVAAAGFPTNDKPYFEILVNTDFNNNLQLTDGQKIYNLVHEIGHCIGLRHSNWQVLQESQSGSSLIPGTPSSDINSVMNGMTALNSWAGFSSYDMQAVEKVYPFSVYDKWLTAPEAKFKSYLSNGYWNGTGIFVNESAEFEIKWNSSLVSTPTVSLQLYQYGQFKANIASNIVNNGSYYFNGTSLIPYQNNPRFVGQFQIKIISDADPLINDKTSLFKLIFSE